jgi:hypothetical protein
VRQARHFVTSERIQRLNVAGPRAGGEPRAHDYAYALVRGLCEPLCAGGPMTACDAAAGSVSGTRRRTSRGWGVGPGRS